MINVDQIRLALQRVVLSEISIDDFDEWFAASSWNMHQDSSPAAQKLAGKIERLLAEFDGNHVSEEDLRTQLSALVSYFVISPQADLQIITGANGSFIQPGWSVVVDRSPAKAPLYTPLPQGQY